MESAWEFLSYIIYLFNCSTYRQGMHDLKVWPGVEADGSPSTKTPGKTSDSRDQMNRLGKLTKKHRKGHMVKVDWLDRLTFREIEMINEVINSRGKCTSNLLTLLKIIKNLF